MKSEMPRRQADPERHLVAARLHDLAPHARLSEVHHKVGSLQMFFHYNPPTSDGN
jgi:hypothetical protein